MKKAPLRFSLNRMKGLSHRSLEGDTGRIVKNDTGRIVKKLLTFAKKANIIQSQWLVCSNIYKNNLTDRFEKRMDGLGIPG